MQIKNKLLNDITKTATGLGGGLANVKGEIESLVSDAIKKHLNDSLHTLDVVGRDEFLAVQKMAQQARIQNDVLQKRIDELEAKIND